ncbi:MAG: hypothetical protein IJ746_06410 [Ruminococcus sp.]|nr:hypothetical protein [Ruminococcus sp.]
MKAADLLRSMSDINERYYIETEPPQLQRGRGLRRPAAMLAAAAACLVLAVSAGAAVRSRRSEAVEHFVSGAEKLTLTEPMVMVSEHVEVTVEAVWSDGHTATVIAEVRGLDPEGRAIMERVDCFAGYADEEYDPEKRVTDGESSSFWSHGSADDSRMYRFTFDLWPTDTSRKIRLYFREKGEDGEPPRLLVTADVSFEKNLDTAELRSEEGKAVTLSPVGLYMSTYLTQGVEMKNIRLYKTDGTVIEDKQLFVSVDNHYSSSVPESSYSRAAFAEVIDIEEIEAVEFDGIRYSRR